MSKLRLESIHDLAPGTTFRFSEGGELATISDPEFHAEACATHYFLHELGIPDSISTDKEEAVQVIWRPGDGDRASSKRPSLAEMLEVAKVALGFGQIERTTMHPDGSFESDTTHTVMLAMAAGEFAERLGLNVSAAVMFAMVHDIPEVYADDTCTAWGLTEDEKEAKDRREEAATVRLKEQLGPESVVMRTLHRYEQQVQPEARLVRYLDKVLPKLTHILNNGDALAAIGMTPDLAAKKHDIQRLALAKQYPEFVDTVGYLYDEAAVAAGLRLTNRTKDVPEVFGPDGDEKETHHITELPPGDWHSLEYFKLTTATILPDLREMVAVPNVVNGWIVGYTLGSALKRK